jgi:hypothetical protein
VQVTLASGLACTGSAQNFITGTTPNFYNIGQGQHFISVAGTGTQTLKAEIDGIDNSGNIYRISDVLELPAAAQASVTGYGYYPKIQVKITCTPGTGTFTLNYSGSFATLAAPVGSYQTGQIDKLEYFGAPANTSATDLFQTPFASTAGTILFQYNVAGPSGSTLVVNCVSAQGFTMGGQPSITLSNSASIQVFQIPPQACPTASVSYTTGGASAATFNLEYIFTSPGIGNGSGTGAQQVQVTGADPCQSSSTKKLSSFANITTATTTGLVNASAGQSVYVCQIVAQLNSTTASTILFEQGTGVACATSPMALTATYSNGTLVSAPVILGGGSATSFSTSSGTGLCAVTTVGTSPTIPVTVTYFVQ